MPAVMVRNGGCRVRHALVLALLLGVCMLPPSASARRTGSFFSWLFYLFSASEVSAPPELSAEDWAAIEKLQVLLHEHNAAQPTAANHMLLGVLAAARRDLPAAEEAFQAAARLAPESPLPITAHAQALLQEGMPDRAARLHVTALEVVTARTRRPSLLSANAHLDVAVAHARLAALAATETERAGCIETARQEFDEALSALGSDSVLPMQRAVGYSQAGLVSEYVLDDPQRAAEVWHMGLLSARESAPGTLQAQMAVQLNVNLAKVEPERDRAVAYLNDAAAATQAMPPEQREPLQVEIGRAYVQAFQGAGPVPEPVMHELKGLAAGVGSEDPRALLLQADVAMLQASAFCEEDPEEARRLEAEAERLRRQARERAELASRQSRM